jgi:hypothetical protein
MAVLSMKVSQPTASAISQTICSSQLPYTYLGHTMNAARNDTLHLTNAANCDSLAVLSLTVNQPTLSSNTQTICASLLPYTYLGHTMNAAGNDTLHLTNAANCDSLAVLSLKLIQPTSSTTIQTICSTQLPYSYLGHTMTKAGNDTLHLINAAGCDSLAILHLNVTIASTSSVVLSAPSINHVCAGTAVTFTATPTNGGTNPAYQWFVNGVNSGFHGAVYTRPIFTNGDIVNVVMTPNLYCKSSPNYTSNSDTIHILPKVTPFIAITRNANNVCAGTPITYTASTVVNGGTLPSYQWMVNNSLVGSNSNSFITSALNNLDTVKCVLTSNYGCLSKPTAVSNQFVVTIHPNVTPSVVLAPPSANNICKGTPVTFTATPTNGGTNPAYQWFVNGVSSGFHGATYTRPIFTNPSIVKVVMTANLYCKNAPNTTSNTDTVTVVGCTTTRLKNPDAEVNVATEEVVAGFELFPNPAMDRVVVRYQLPDNNVAAATISIMDITGKQVSIQTIEHPETIGLAHFDVSQLQAGIYLVNVKTTGYTETKRLVISK